MKKFILKLLPACLRRKSHTIHILRLEGAIVAERSLGGKAINGKSLEPLLKKAFRKNVSAVALAINCPGGSPVQSAIIASRIRALSAEHKIPVYAFCEDVAASGGYWLACAADEIYADENSIVGSIGVIAGGFGFPQAMKKLGVERRVHTSGESKSTNDPFKPEKPEDVKKLKAMLEDMHESFKAMVRARREGKLKDTKELFSGAYWTGRKSLDLGLIDGLGHLEPVMRHKFGDKIDLVEIEAPKGWGLKRLGFSAATELPEAVLNTLETRALWQRFGL
ncbi:MAG: S49 family peptidase [Alphaproteobacteria bacterium]|nr:S49 family peptidase [Alphaproteobacteria bacterium]